MSDDIILEEGEESVCDDNVFSEQINILLNMGEIDFSGLYEKWEEDKIKVITTAMKIINERQKAILKDLK